MPKKGRAARRKRQKEKKAAQAAASPAGPSDKGKAAFLQKNYTKALKFFTEVRLRR